MVLIPGWLVSILTFPGVIVHEIAHRLFCDLVKIPVYKVSYFRLGNPAGYVVHGPVDGLRKSFLISIGPLLMNSALCVLLTFSAILPVYILEVKEYSFVFNILIWVGFSIGMHAFPSNDDMQNFVQAVKDARQGGVLLFVSKIFAGLLKIANALRVIWFDAIYAVLLSLLLPWLLGVL